MMGVISKSVFKIPGKTSDIINGRLYLGILSRKFLLQQHDNGNLIVATMTTITTIMTIMTKTMKNPYKIK